MIKQVVLSIVAGALLPTLAYAHVGPGEASGFIHGLAHISGVLKSVSGMTYALGLILSLASLHIIRIMFLKGRRSRRRSPGGPC